MTTLDIQFHSLQGRAPYIVNRASTEYTCDGKEGSITFDGYYYVEDHADSIQEDHAPEEGDAQYLPQTLYLFMNRREKEPYKTEVSEMGYTTSHYRTIEEYAYIVEVYKRVKHESTDRISNIEDSDGEDMKVCFFPTNKQTIYFRVLDAEVKRKGKGTGTGEDPDKNQDIDPHQT